LNFLEKSIDKTERSLKKFLSFFTKINQVRKEDFLKTAQHFNILAKNL